MYVEVVSYETGEVVKTLGPYASERLAEKAERGVEANLDHENYYTRTVAATAT
jgi:hypothetical protein